MPGSLAEAVADLDGGALDALAALRTFDDARTREGLARLVGADHETRAADRSAELDRALRQLEQHALVWTVGEQQLCLAEPLRDGEGELNLGRGLRPLLEGLRAGSLTAIARRLDVDPAKRKADTLDAVEKALHDPDFVRSVLAAAPTRAREVAESAAWHGPRTSTPAPWEPDFAVPSSGNPQHLAWLAERGLLVPAGGEFLASPVLRCAYEMPREIALAVRGPDYAVPLRGRPRSPSIAHRDATEVDRAATAAATRFLDGVDRLVELSSSHPARVLKTGGIGVRELRRLGKSLRAGESQLRLWLEVAHEADLLEHADDALVPSAVAADWRAGEPADRIVRLLLSWWSLPASPETAAAQDKPPPALLAPEEPLDGLLRQDLLHELCRLEPGSAPQDWAAVDELVAWRRPVLHADARTIAEPAASIRREGDEVGALALDALSSLGRELAGGDVAALRETAGRLMPRAQESVVLQADLTATVSGMPSSSVVDALNRMATAESRDTASVWRFDPSSIRRAMDHGHTAEELLEQLAELAGGPLPQPLEYLVRDVGRRFGELTVAPVSCCVLSQDPNLLQEVLHHRLLRNLELRQLAPTVLASGSGPEQTLHRLREAGYAPTAQDERGALQLSRQKDATAGTTGPSPTEPGSEPLDPAHPDARDVPALAARLLDTAGQDDELHRSRTEQDVHQRAGRLSPGERRVLSHAVEAAAPVRIEYVDQNGSPSERTITPLEFAPPWIRSFCHLRQAERDFRLERIRTISPAPAMVPGPPAGRYG